MNAFISFDIYVFTIAQVVIHHRHVAGTLDDRAERSLQLRGLGRSPRLLAKSRRGQAAREEPRERDDHQDEVGHGGRRAHAQAAEEYRLRTRSGSLQCHGGGAFPKNGRSSTGWNRGVDLG